MLFVLRKAFVTIYILVIDKEAEENAAVITHTITKNVVLSDGTYAR